MSIEIEGSAQTYQKKPILIHAIRHFGWNWNALCDFAPGKVRGEPVTDGSTEMPVMVQTPHGETRMLIGEWLVRDSDGDFYPCTDSIFRAGHEVAV